jgi:hypothetical protein
MKTTDREDWEGMRLMMNLKSGDLPISTTLLDLREIGRCYKGDIYQNGSISLLLGIPNFLSNG